MHLVIDRSLHRPNDHTVDGTVVTGMLEGDRAMRQSSASGSERRCRWQMGVPSFRDSEPGSSLRSAALSIGQVYCDHYRVVNPSVANTHSDGRR